MGSLMTFYWKKSIRNLKQQWLVILSIGISISLVAGLGYYIEAVYNHQFDESFQFMHDMEISHEQIYGRSHSAIPRMEFTANFQDDYEQVMHQIQISGLDTKSTYRYGILSMEEVIWVHDDWESINVKDCTSEFDYQRKMNATEVEFAVFDETFYSSDRFHEYFKVIEGRTPEDPQDILVEYRFAIQHGLKVGEIANITLLIGSDLDANPPMVDYGDFQLKNVNISGIYVAILEEYIIDTEYFVYSYLYEDFLKGEQIEISEGFFDEPAMFSYYNFTGPDMEHPFQLLHQEIDNDPEYYQYLRSAYTRSGYIILYNRDDFQFDKILDTMALVNAQSFNLSRYLPMDHGFVDILSFQMNIFYQEFRQSKAFIRLLYIPVLIFTLFISIILIRSFREEQIKQLFYIKTLGLTDKTLRRQALVEGTLKGFVSSFAGLFLGFGIFYLYEFMFRGVFISDPLVELSPYITMNNVLTSIAIGFFINILSIIQVIRTISKMVFEELAQNVKIEKYPAKFDEFMIFSPKKKLKEKFNAQNEGQTSALISHNDKMSLSSVKISQDSEKDIKNSVKISFKDRLHNLWLGFKNSFSDNIYEEQYDELESKISVKSWLLIGIGILPIIFYSLISLSYIFHYPDSLIDTINVLENNMELLQILLFCGIVLIIVGLIRIFVVEKPKFYAKWSKFLSRGLLKDLDKYVGVKMIGKTKWTTIFTFLTIIFSLLISLNIIYQSTNSYQYLADSMKTGTDAKLHLQNPLVKSHADILEFNQNLQNLTDAENTTLVEQSVFVYLNPDCHLVRTTPLGVVSQDASVYTVPSENYIEMLETRDRVPPTPNFYRIFDKMHEFNTHNTNITGVIVTSAFTEFSSLRVGDLFELSYTYLLPQDESQISLNFQVEIIGVLDLLPGVYTSIQGETINGLFIDFNEIVQPENYIYGEKYFSLLNLENYHSVDQQNEISQIFNDYAQPYCEYPAMSFYNLDWNAISRDDLSMNFGESGFYGIFYYDFIIIGFFVVLEVSIMALLLLKSNNISDKRLIGRGMKKKIIKRINFVEFFITYLSALILGIIIGIGSGSLFIKMNQVIEFHQTGAVFPSSASLPIIFGYQHVALIIGIYLAITFIIFSVGYTLKQKTYSKTSGEKIFKQQITPRI